MTIRSIYLSDLSRKCWMMLVLVAFWGAESPADNGTRPGMTNVPVKMMPLFEMNIEFTLSKVKVVSTK